VRIDTAAELFLDHPLDICNTAAIDFLYFLAITTNKMMMVVLRACAQRVGKDDNKKETFL
jgi:hypothetical protein